MKKILLAILTISALFLAGCREVDVDAVHGVLIPGTDSQYRFCDGPTLIYFTDVSGSDDEFDAIWPGLCSWNEDKQLWEYDFAAASNSRNTPNGNAPEEK